MNLTTNSLKITSTVAGGKLSIASGKTLTLTSNGLLFNGTGDYTITGGTLSVSGGTNDMILQQYGTGNLTIASAINEGNYDSAFDKSGPGKVTLTNTANNITGV